MVRLQITRCSTKQPRYKPNRPFLFDSSFAFTTYILVVVNFHTYVRGNTSGVSAKSRMNVGHPIERLLCRKLHSYCCALGANLLGADRQTRVHCDMYFNYFTGFIGGSFLPNLVKHELFVVAAAFELVLASICHAVLHLGARDRWCPSHSFASALIMLPTRNGIFHVGGSNDFGSVHGIGCTCRSVRI